MVFEEGAASLHLLVYDSNEMCDIGTKKIDQGNRETCIEVSPGLMITPLLGKEVGDQESYAVIGEIIEGCDNVMVGERATV